MESMSNKDYFSLFMDFGEWFTLVMLQSGLNTLYTAEPWMKKLIDCESGR
jgi:hypothetical protein